MAGKQYEVACRVCHEGRLVDDPDQPLGPHGDQRVPNRPPCVGSNQPVLRVRIIGGASRVE
jgi:hypothetical protein